ncbi:histone acetyltransferase subunit NuA4-domain-containing protein [Mortierella sp. GBAus27b]|nr:histone acetyltransferase subunit NuA4-domain-containing protein [Mortierella sp. GBAus27b]
MPDAPGEKVTHQQYNDAKTELSELISRKKIVDRNLASLENSIYAFEGSYLEDTQHGGNIIRGFDGYINSKSDKSRVKYSESDRLFSMSSTTFTKALQIKENPDQESSQDEGKRPSSISSTKRPNLKTSGPIMPSMGPSSSPAPGSSTGRRLVKQQKSGLPKSGSDQRPPKKIRLSSGREGDDEDLDV